jgi:TM2 domain-containing membrane protein YozV/RNA polymerase subunit RPABC4/transcription elongation factor Spt4
MRNAITSTSVQNSPTASIILERTSSWHDRLRAYKLLINDIEIGGIRDNERLEIRVDPGKHKIQLTIDWCKSLPITIILLEGETKNIICEPASRLYNALLYLTLYRNKYITVRPLEKTTKHPNQERNLMFCRNCSKQIDSKAIVCINCGVAPQTEKKYCRNCGAATNPNQAICLSCGVSTGIISGNKSKPTTTLLNLFLGTFGAHKFYLGNWGWGIIYLLLGITFFLAWIPFIASFVELIRVILMSDQEFSAKVEALKEKGPFGFLW